MKAELVSDLVVSHKPRKCYQPGPITFRLVEPLEVTIDGVRYRAPADTATDGASTPRVLRSLVPRVGRHIYAAVIHDAAYRGVLEYLKVSAGTDCQDHPWWRPTRQSIDRRWADDAFMALMVSADVGWFTRHMAYLAVRLFGRSRWHTT